MTGPGVVLAAEVTEQEIERRIAIAREHLKTPRTNFAVYQRSEVIVALAERRASAAALAESRKADLVAAMAVIGDLLAETLSMEGQWSPGLDKAREAGRMLLKEWSAGR